MKLTETLRELLVKKVIHDNIFEAVSPALMSQMLSKYANETDEDESTIRAYVEDFDKYKNSLNPNMRDITKYSFIQLKSLIDDLKSKKEWRKLLNSTIKVYMDNEELGRGSELDRTKLNIKKFFEIVNFLPKNKRDIMKIPYLELSSIISDYFEPIIRSEGFKYLKKTNPTVMDEQILGRLEVYLNSYGELPFYSRPLFGMTFDEFELIVDALPQLGEDLAGEIDVSDIQVVYEDDDVLVFLGDDKQRCINIRKKYAPDRTWCTSYETSSNYFYNYRLRKNLTLYYVINKNIDTSNVDYASVILVEKNGEMRLADGTNRDRYSGHQTIPWNEIVGKIPPLKDKKSVFKPIPLTDNEIENFTRIENLKVVEDAVKELGYEEAQMWLELTSKDLTKYPNGTIIFLNLPQELKKKYIGLGINLNSEMISKSDSEIQKYHLSKKLQSLINKPIGSLTDSDIALIKSPIFPKKLIGDLKTKYLNDSLGASWGNTIDIKPKNNAEKYISLFGFEEFIDRLPNTVVTFFYTGDGYFDNPLPPSFCKFKNLEVLTLKSAINSLPECIGDMESLTFISLIGNKNLTKIPEDIYLLPKLTYLGVKPMVPSMLSDDEINERRESQGLEYLMVSYV